MSQMSLGTFVNVPPHQGLEGSTGRFVRPKAIGLVQVLKFTAETLETLWGV